MATKERVIVFNDSDISEVKFNDRNKYLVESAVCDAMLEALSSLGIRTEKLRVRAEAEPVLSIRGSVIDEENAEKGVINLHFIIPMKKQ